jgi:hypothetical protein
VEQDSAPAGRELADLVVARAGRVAQTSDPTLPWVVLDGAGARTDAADAFLKELLASGSSAASCRSYAFDLLRWFRFPAAVDVAWERASRAEVRDFVLWLRSSRPTQPTGSPRSTTPGGKPSARLTATPPAPALWSRFCLLHRHMAHEHVVAGLATALRLVRPVSNVVSLTERRLAQLPANTRPLPTVTA